MKSQFCFGCWWYLLEFFPQAKIPVLIGITYYAFWSFTETPNPLSQLRIISKWITEQFNKLFMIGLMLKSAKDVKKEREKPEIKKQKVNRSYTYLKGLIEEKFG